LRALRAGNATRHRPLDINQSSPIRVKVRLTILFLVRVRRYSKAIQASPHAAL
jgi:hypothetical protein